MTKPDIDLTKIHKKYTMGDITVYLTWFGEHNRPCLVLLPTFRSRDSYKPAVILVDDAYQWATETGSAFYVQQQSIKIAKALDFTPTPQTLARIANIIADSIGELLNIPPKPSFASKVVADAFITQENGKQKHFEITENE